ncbi:MAG: hypothetical protein R3Y47_11270 [Lachnospiraceae bacterium]
MQQFDRFKNRLPIEEARDSVVEFFKNQRIMNISLATQEQFPVIDSIDYFYFQGEHLAVIPPMSKLAKLLGNGSEFSGFIQEGFGKGAKKFYAHISATQMDGTEKILEELAVANPMISKMKAHNAKFMKLNFVQATLSLSHAEVYEIDNDLNPTFAKFAPNGRERFEDSRQVLMNYLDRNVIFSVVIEDGVYYCLAKSDSNKMEYIKNGGICKFYDGKNNHFEAVINIVDEKKDAIFEKLKATNNDYFKQNEGLTALSFTKISE